MEELTLKAPAKINLFLHIKGRRPDGYHQITTVMQSVSLCDELSIRLTPTRPAVYLCDNRPAAPDNLICRAAAAFFRETGLKESVQISLTKSIPLSSGMGGGSADAAAVLRGLNQLYGHPLSNEKLLCLGASLGADVPFCLLGGRCLATGIGEQLTVLPQKKKYAVLLIKQHEKQSTGQMYALADALPPRSAAPGAVEKHFRAGEDEKAFLLCENDFLAVSAAQKEQQEFIAQLYRAGAALAGLSGSGPTVFGLFSENCDRVYEEFSAAGAQVYCGCTL